MITGDTTQLGLIGQHARYTLSPAMHNYACEILRRDSCYQYYDVPPAILKQFLDVAWHVGFQGLNVTQPHKESVAQLVGGHNLTSVNTLTRGQEWWLGHTTDGEGFDKGLLRLNCRLDDFKNILILGSGGAAQSVVAQATTQGAPKKNITIMRRSSVRDYLLRGLVPINHNLQTLDWDSNIFCQRMRDTNDTDTLVIQATNLKANHEAYAGFSPGLDDFKGVFVDLIYDQPSVLYHECNAKNLRCLDGLPMLIEQARLSQNLWWGKSAAYEQLALAIKNTGVFQR